MIAEKIRKVQQSPVKIQFIARPSRRGLPRLRNITRISKVDCEKMHVALRNPFDKTFYLEQLAKARTLLVPMFGLSVKKVLDHDLPAPGIGISRSQGVPDRGNRPHSI